MNRKPWMDQNGGVVSETELREMARSWGAEVWEDFLKNTIDHPLRESLAESAQFEIGAARREDYQELLAKDEHPRLAEILVSLMDVLTIRERYVVHQIFWEGKGQHEIARDLRIARCAVRNYRDRALRKLGMGFIGRLLPAVLTGRSEDLGQKKAS